MCKRSVGLVDLRMFGDDYSFFTCMEVQSVSIGLSRQRYVSDAVQFQRELLYVTRSMFDVSDSAMSCRASYGGHLSRECTRVLADVDYLSCCLSIFDSPVLRCRLRASGEVSSCRVESAAVIECSVCGLLSALICTRVRNCNYSIKYALTALFPPRSVLSVAFRKVTFSP